MLETGLHYAVSLVRLRHWRGQSGADGARTLAGLTESDFTAVQLQHSFKLEMGRYVENIEIYRRYRYYRHRIVSMFLICVFEISYHIDDKWNNGAVKNLTLISRVFGLGLGLEPQVLNSLSLRIFRNTLLVNLNLFLRSIMLPSPSHQILTTPVWCVFATIQWEGQGSARERRFRSVLEHRCRLW